MNISLTAEQASFVEQLVACGEYLCPEEVVGDAVRLLRDLKELERIRLERLRKEIAIGVEQADRGELVELDMEEIKATARRRPIPNQKAG